VQYLSVSGAIRRYYPNFVGVQTTSTGSANWIIETIGREFEDTDTKAQYMDRWCAEVSDETREVWP
jgi:type III restriction enzyme